MIKENSERLINEIYDDARELVKFYTKHPEMMTDSIKAKINELYSAICEKKGLSEHSGWGVKWTLEKRHNETDAAPYETMSGNFTPDQSMVFVGNVILNTGANEILKLICGDSSANAYSNTNAKIFVGTDSTPESPEQTGVIAAGSNRAFAAMDSGYPQVSSEGRTAIFRATFGDSVANFEWNEVSLTNGSGSGAVSLNRKQINMGTKNGGSWSMQLEVSVVNVA